MKIVEKAGITLISLVITIIVLLILAGVSISLVVGNNGVLTQATNAVNKNREVTAEEEIAMAWASCETDYWSAWANNSSISKDSFFNKTNMIKYLTGIGIVDDFIYRENGNSKIIYRSNSSTKVESESYTIYKNGKVIKSGPVIGELITKDNYGDYIDLGQSVVGTSATTDDWRILYNDKNEYVYAILAKLLPNTNEAIKNAEFEKVKNTSTGIKCQQSSRENFIKVLNDATVWNTLIPSELVDKGANVLGTPTGELLTYSYNEKYNQEFDYTIIRSAFYIENDSNKGIDSLYCPNDISDSYGYWLSSTYDDNYNDKMWLVFANGGFTWTDGYSVGAYALCPVVSIPADMQVTSTTSNGITIWSMVQ